MSKKFEIGQKVCWSSQALGYTTTKVGLIETVVPAGVAPRALNIDATNDGMPRDHESYLVRVPTPAGKGKGKLYWPKVANLAKAKASATLVVKK